MLQFISYAISQYYIVIFHANFHLQALDRSIITNFSSVKIHMLFIKYILETAVYYNQQNI